MTIGELKTQIESNTLSGNLIIFQITDTDFIPNQYIKEISNTTNMDVEYLDGLDDILHPSFSLFEDVSPTSNTLRVFNTDVFDCESSQLMNEKYLIVVTKKFGSPEVESLFKHYIVEVPKLCDWQVKDYVFSVAEGVKEVDLEWLYSLYGKNLYRLENELDKIKLFTPTERGYLFESLKRDGAYSDSSSYNIFNLTNALSSKDIGAIKNIYSEIDRVDISEFGLLAILVKNFRNILMVQTNNNPTPETTFIDGKQLYAIKKLPKVYSPEQLVNIYAFLCSIDKMVKSGELPTDIMIDYLIIKILSI